MPSMIRVDAREPRSKMPNRSPPSVSRRHHHRRSRSHISPQRRPRRRTHSHSPVRRHGRDHHHHFTRGRSPTRHVPGTARVSRTVHDTTTLTTTCSTMPSYSISYSPQRHRDAEVSSTACLIRADRRDSSEDDENRENRRRQRTNNAAAYVEEAMAEEDLKKDSVKGRICRAAKVVSGFLIAMGLILVFYVIITTILGESTPLDIFDFEFGTGNILKHQNNRSDNLLTPRNQVTLPNKKDITGFTLDVIELEPRSTGNRSVDSPSGGLPVGEILKRRDYTDEEEQNEYRENETTYDYDVAYTHDTVSTEGNTTDPNNLEGRSYIAYIPVPLNNEDEDEEQEEEEEDKDKSDNRRASPTKPMFVPVMIVPDATQPIGRNRHPMSLPNFRPSQQFPLPPNRGPLLVQPPRGPLPPMRNIPRVVPGSQNSLLNQNTILNRQPNPLLPLLPPRNEFQNPDNTHLLNPSMFNVHHENTQNNGMSNNFNHGNLNGNGANSPFDGTDMGIKNTGNRVNNLGNTGTSRSQLSGDEAIWNTLHEIMRRGQASSAPQRPSGTSERMSTSGYNRLPSRTPVGFSARPSLPSLPDLRRMGPPDPRLVDGVGPGLSAARRRLSPRLLPKSRMSGPLPKPRVPPPRYRFRLPPIPPPPGMPIVPRRTVKPNIVKPPTDFQYQYPKDSASIQDIIRFMKDHERQQQTGSRGSEINFGPDPIGGQINFRPNNDFTIGDQNHIIGPSPFEDTISDLNEGYDGANFGNDAQPGHNFNVGGPGFTRSGNKYPGGSFSVGGGGSNIAISGGGGIPGFNSDGNKFYNGGYNNNNGDSNFNNFRDSNNNGNYNHYNNGGNKYNTGGNNFNNDGNSFNNNGNHFNNDGSNFNSGGNLNNGGNNFNNGGNHYNNGGNSFNSGSSNNGNYGGQNSHNDGASSVIPSVFNTYNAGISKSRPFNIMLDVYPMEAPSGSTGSSSSPRPFQTSVTYDSNDIYTTTGQRQFGNSDEGNSGGYIGGGRFGPKEDANKHEIVLHLNLYSKTPSSKRRNGDGFSGRSGAVSLSVPLTGQLSPLDIYTAIMAKARAEKPQARVQYMSGEEASGERDEVEIELFDVEEGPRLLEAITQGLEKLNQDLPPDKRFVINKKVSSPFDLYEAVNGETVVASAEDSTFSAAVPPTVNSTHSTGTNIFANHNYNSTSSHHQPGNSDTDYYYYYDYYEYEDNIAAESDNTKGGMKTRQDSLSTTTVSSKGPYEQLPTPCWHKTDGDGDDLHFEYHE